ncbi:transposase ISSoc2 [Faustovirus]|nr:transposase ISSoc2 [Faustovirus]
MNIFLHYKYYYINIISMHLFNEEGNLKVNLQELRKICESEKFQRSETGFWNQNCSIIKDKLLATEFINHDKATDTIISRRIKFKPNYLQRKLLNDCFGAYRWIYNKAIDVIFEVKKYSDKFNCIIDIKLVKKAIYENVKINDDEIPDFIKILPSDSRKEALREAIKNYKTCLTHLNKKLCRRFLLKHKRKDATTFRIKTNAIKLTGNKLVIFKKRILDLIEAGNLNKDLRYATLNNGNLRRLKPYLNASGNPTAYPLINYSHGNYYIIVSGNRKVEQCNVKKEICAIDPGVVNFHTIYDGVVGYEGVKLYETRLEGINQRIDKITQHKQNFTGAKRKRMHLRELKLRAKVSNIVYQFRHTLASKLCNKYKVILLPKLGIKQVAKHLRRQVNRKLYALSHYKFNELIKQIATRTGTTVIHCLESYTSKTCGNCGNLQTCDVDRTFRCRACYYVADRDENACKNILIRSLNNYILSCSSSGKRK